MQTPRRPRFSRVAMASICACILAGACQKSPQVPQPAARRPVPKADLVSSAQIMVTVEGQAEARCVISITDAKTIGPLIFRLEQVDWSQKGESLAEIRVRPPEIEIVFTDVGEQKHRYAFYWEGNALMGDQRLIQADLNELRCDVVDLVIRHTCGAAQSQGARRKHGEANPPQAALAGNAPPSEDDVAAIDIVAAATGGAGPHCQLTIKDAYWIGKAVRWLHAIDWSQEGDPLERMQILKPEIEMDFIEKGGAVHRYKLYWWEEGFIDVASLRLLQADVSGFRYLVIQALIAHCAARAATVNLELQGTYKPKDEPYAVAFAPAADLLAVAYPRSRTLELWDVEQRKIALRTNTAGRVRQLGFTSDGKHLVCLVEPNPPPETVLNTREIQLLAVPELRPVRKLDAVTNGGGWRTLLSFSPDGRYAATATSYALKIWSVDTGQVQEIPTRKARGAPLEENYQPLVAFSPDGALLAVSPGDLTVSLWTLENVKAPRRAATFATDAPVASLSFSPGGELLVAGPGPSRPEGDAPAPIAWVKSPLAWNVTTREPISLPVQQSAVEMHVAFAPAGMVLATAGDGAISIWDLTRWSDEEVKLLDTAKAHLNGVYGIQPAVREQAFLTYGPDAIHVWRLTPPHTGGPTRDAANDPTLPESFRDDDAALQGRPSGTEEQSPSP